MHVLFICTGNICRSPIAERLLAAHSAKYKQSSLTVSSAGTRALIGHPVHREAAAVLQALGGDASDFCARQLTERLARDADLILTMTRAHRDSVLELAPTLLRRTFTFTEAARLVSEYGADRVSELATNRTYVDPLKCPDIADPVGQNAEFFKSIGAEIDNLVSQILRVCL